MSIIVSRIPLHSPTPLFPNYLYDYALRSTSSTSRFTFYALRPLFSTLNPSNSLPTLHSSHPLVIIMTMRRHGHKNHRQHAKDQRLDDADEHLEECYARLNENRYERTNHEKQDRSGEDVAE
jgi:hypothetical protein